MLYFEKRVEKIMQITDEEKWRRIRRFNELFDEKNSLERKILKLKVYEERLAEFNRELDTYL